MKKTVASILILTMLLGVLSAFSFVGAYYGQPDDDIPYSGGSGTEEDPYLISTAADLREIYDTIIAFPRLWSTKVYYKLTNNINTNYSISPLFESYRTGKNCFVKTDYTVEYVKVLRNRYNEEELWEWYSDIISRMGPLYGKVDMYVNDSSSGMHMAEAFLEKYDVTYLLTHADIYYAEVIGRQPSVFSFDFYRQAAFTGVFDGNGYTINCNGYLFGFLENGAEIKNLKISGKSASLAYQVGESCTVSNCTINSDITYADIYECEGDRGYEGNVYEVSGGAIAKNYGTVKSCINFADGISGLIGYNYGEALNCANYGKITPSGEEVGYTDRMLLHFLKKYNSGSYDGWDNTYDVRVFYMYVPSPDGIHNGKYCIDYYPDNSSPQLNGYFSLSECIAADGNVLIYQNEGFDFENDWIMLNGYPVLRSACRANSGDLNVDGTVNTMDSNLMKRHLTGTGVSEAFIFLGGADVNLDGEINAMDSALLKMKLAG